MHLIHLPLPYLTPYTAALTFQARLLAAHLAHLSFSPNGPRPGESPPRPPSPPPTLLTFTPPPVFTPGRREPPYSPSLIHELTSRPIVNLHPTFHPSQRGGLITYHGPGQVVGFLICHLPTHSLSLRPYVHLLEEATIRTCAHFGVNGFRSEVNPGVWISEEEKVCALGVHLRRRVSQYGVGLNVTGTVREGFQRIVGCGLEGKRAGWLARGIGDMDRDEEKGKCRKMGEVFAGEVAGLLDGVDEVRRVNGLADVLGQGAE